MGRVQKQQFRNEDAGWIGVVAIGPKGEDRGMSVAPGDTVWLSEDEQRLTANAPRKPEDNPFIAQKRERINQETGAREEYELTPLVPIDEDRWVPANERYIPGDQTGSAVTRELQSAASGDEPVQVVSDPDALAARHAEVSGDPDAQPHVHRASPAPTPPPRAAAAAAASQAVEETVEEPQPPAGPPVGAAPMPPGAYAPGSEPLEPSPEIQGENEAKVAAQPTPPVEEEQAAVAPTEAVGEEVGAAVTPSQEAAQGEYAATEEVGTPDAPQAAPAPYTPPDGE